MMSPEEIDTFAGVTNDTLLRILQMISDLNKKIAALDRRIQTLEHKHESHH